MTASTTTNEQNLAKGVKLLMQISLLSLLFITGSRALSSVPGIAGDHAVEDTITFTDDLFESDEMLELTIRFDISRFMEEKPEDEYLQAVVTNMITHKDSVNTNVRLRARGNFRYRLCSFPPIRINLSDSDVEGAIIPEIDNLKVVTHCDDNEMYEVYLLREFLIYRIYNLVTDYSFRVRLMKVRYIDTGSKGLSFEKYAFIIEPLEMLLARLASEEVDVSQLDLSLVKEGFLDRIALFECLIGNSDWFVPIVHNFKIISPNDQEGDRVIPIPYDFDYSGFVNAFYSSPRVDLGIETIRDRAYLGPCRDEAGYRPVLDEFLSHREEIIKLIRKFEPLSWEDRNDLLVYVKSFYYLYRKDRIIDLMNINCNK